MKILIVEDEPTLASRIERALKVAGHETRVANDGPSGLKTALETHFDLLLLDVNLPGCDGFTVLQKLREKSVSTRVMILTARSEVGDRVTGLRSGADDYLTKPFALEELLARVDALGRREAKSEVLPLLEVGGLCMELATRKLTVNGEKVELSQRAFEVLAIFMKEPGRTFSRSEICERVWEREHEYDTRTVEIFIMRLRKKVDFAAAGVRLATVRGIGYLLERDE